MTNLNEYFPGIPAEVVAALAQELETSDGESGGGGVTDIPIIYVTDDTVPYNVVPNTLTAYSNPTQSDHEFILPGHDDSPYSATPGDIVEFLDFGEDLHPSGAPLANALMANYPPTTNLVMHPFGPGFGETLYAALGALGMHQYTTLRGKGLYVRYRAVDATPLGDPNIWWIVERTNYPNLKPLGPFSAGFVVLSSGHTHLIDGSASMSVFMPGTNGSAAGHEFAIEESAGSGTGSITLDGFGSSPYIDPAGTLTTGTYVITGAPYFSLRWRWNGVHWSIVARSGI
jgi:hypothetical protein